MQRRRLGLYAFSHVFVPSGTAWLSKSHAWGKNKKRFGELPYLTDEHARCTIVFSVQLFQLILRVDRIKKFYLFI